MNKKYYGKLIFELFVRDVRAYYLSKTDGRCF